MKGLFSDSALETMKKLKKIFLWSAVCALIGVFLLGAIMILSDGAGGAGMGRLIGTLSAVSVALFVGVNNFTRIESGDKLIQGFGLMSLGCNLIWLILAILLIWEIVPSTYYEYGSSRWGSVTLHVSAWVKIMSVAISLGAAGFWVSNVLSIKETVRPVKPLKITAIVCEVYCSLFAIVVILSDMYSGEMGKWYTLSGFAALAFIATACAALIVSKSGAKNEQNVAAPVAPAGNVVPEVNNPVQKSDEQLRAEIEEQVRREMIEKEVRARMEAEMGKKEGEQ